MLATSPTSPADTTAGASTSGPGGLAVTSIVTFAVFVETPQTLATLSE